MIEEKMQKADVLLSQKKYKEASKLLKEILLDDPNDAVILSKLMECYLQLDRHHEALQIINSAIALEPEWDYLFYYRARVYIQLDEYQKAEEDLNLAISMDPEDADYYATLAAIKLDLKDYKTTLELANKSLSFDPTNTLGLNMRSSSLNKLKNKKEALESFEVALKENPNNCFTHHSLGWVLLENGDYEKALYHFKETLRIDPTYDTAKTGMMEVLKAKYLFYRLFLKYSFWMNNIQNNRQWYFIVGFFFVFKLVSILIAGPFIFTLGILIFSAWIIDPISNLLIRFNSLGKLLLSDEDIKITNFVGASLLLFLTGITCYLITFNSNFIPLFIVGITFILPVNAIYKKTKIPHLFKITAIAIGILGVISCIIPLVNGKINNDFFAIYILTIILFQWTHHYAIIEE